MSLHRDFLEQARRLATLDPRRPKQVNLRRAVSASYYALFHLLTWEASRKYATDPRRVAQIARSFNHGEMRRVSTFFMNSRLPRSLPPTTSGYVMPPVLVSIAKTFISLQQVRHDADYDLTRGFDREEVLTFVQDAERAFEDWSNVKDTDDARLYLACFLLWKRWDDDAR